MHLLGDVLKGEVLHHVQRALRLDPKGGKVENLGVQIPIERMVMTLTTLWEVNELTWYMLI